MNDDWLYGEVVKEHFFNPKNYLATDTYEADGIGTAGSPICGDLMKVWIRVNPHTNKITDCKWRTFGCASAIASTSMMSEIVLENGGMSLEDARKVTAEGIMERLGGLPDNKIHCSVLGHLALREAIDDYAKKNKLDSAKDSFYLKSKKEVGPGVFTLDFQSKSTMFDFIPGQFVMAKIVRGIATEGLSRAYTNTSLSGEECLSLTVKRAGIFSNALCDLALEDEVALSGPYGNFYPKEGSLKKLVFLAGGVGAMPFYAIIKNEYKNKTGRHMTLFYSNKTSGDIIFHQELKGLTAVCKNFKLVTILTRDTERKEPADEYKRIDSEMVKKYIGDLNGNDYFICGPSAFVLGMKEELKTAGVDPHDIKIEAFY